MTDTVRKLRDHAYRVRLAGRALRHPPRTIDERDRYERGFAVLEQAADRLVPGYVLGEYGKSWQSERAFADEVQRLQPGTRRHHERKWTLVELLKLIDGVPGDTVEMGVFEGATSYLVCEATRGAGRTHWAIDSFEGLSSPDAADGAYWVEGDLTADEQRVRALLEPFGARVVRGWLPPVLDDVPAEQLAFVHIDVDLYEPTLASAAWGYERLAAGGLLVCDDYGFESCPGARRAIDELFADRPEPVVHLATGQALVIKR